MQELSVNQHFQKVVCQGEMLERFLSDFKKVYIWERSDLNKAYLL